MQWRWSYSDQSPSGRLWVWSLIIFLVFRCLVSVKFGPYTQTRGVGGLAPTIVVGGSKGGDSWCPSPPDGGSREVPSKCFFYEKCLVKYCNFVVNLDHSLCRRYDCRSYVNIRVFCPIRHPSIIYERIVLWLCVILREETVREWRGSYNRCQF